MIVGPRSPASRVKLRILLTGTGGAGSNFLLAPTRALLAREKRLNLLHHLASAQCPDRFLPNIQALTTKSTSSQRGNDPPYAIGLIGPPLPNSRLLRTHDVSSCPQEAVFVGEFGRTGSHLVSRYSVGSSRSDLHGAAQSEMLVRLPGAGALAHRVARDRASNRPALTAIAIVADRNDPLHACRLRPCSRHLSGAEDAHAFVEHLRR
jgi:hypothetical protein